MKALLVFSLVLTLLAGCASMSKTECRNADWQLIGYEDGAAGRPASRIGDRRKACADHDIVPDFQAYKAGHAEGVREYCTASRGFEFGRRGGKYYGICPDDLEGEFLDGYTIGQEHHAVISDIRHYDSVIRGSRAELKKLRHRVKDNAVFIISDDTSKEERAEGLIEIAEDNARIGELEAKIVEYEKLRAVKQVEYEHLEAPVFY